MIGPKLIAPAIALVFLAGASPASAQRGRADDIARDIRDAADAVGTITDAIYDSVDGIRYRGREHFAVSRCASRVGQYGRMRVQDVRRYSRRSWRVYGTIDGRGDYGGRYGGRYDVRDGYPSRSFTCTVRDDGRVKLKTKRLRY